MNFISHKEAVSVFPKATFIDRRFYVCSRTPLGSEWSPDWARKYEKRGFEIYTRNVVIDTSIVGTRTVKDQFSWVIGHVEGKYVARIPVNSFSTVSPLPPQRAAHEIHHHVSFDRSIARKS